MKSKIKTQWIAYHIIMRMHILEASSQHHINENDNEEGSYFISNFNKYKSLAKYEIN